jgi:Tol biopolymer transport system component
VLAWSPDKSKLAYQETHSQQEELWIFDMQTRQPRKITTWQRNTVPTDVNSQFVWAYDSHHFLFSTGIPGQYALYLGNSNRLLGQPIQLQDAHIHFAWSPTQLQFAYFSGTKLIIQNLQRQTLPVQIGHQPGLAGTSLAWNPDGTKIAICGKRENNFDIYLLFFSENAPLLQSLVSSSSDDLQPSWSPDGQHVAFYVRSDQYDTKVAVAPADKSRNPYIVGHNASLPPDGGPRWLTNTELVYMGEEHLSASQNSIYRINIKTGQRSSAPVSLLLAQ